MRKDSRFLLLAPLTWALAACAPAPAPDAAPATAAPATTAPAAAAGGTDAAAPEPLPESAEARLLAGISAAYQPLSECMVPLLSAEPAQVDALMRRAYAAADPALLQAQAASVVGSDSPALQAALALDEGAAGRAESLLAVMTTPSTAVVEGRDDVRERTLATKGLALAMIALAAGSEGRCVPGADLRQWIEQVPHADS